MDYASVKALVRLTTLQKNVQTQVCLEYTQRVAISHQEEDHKPLVISKHLIFIINYVQIFY